MEVLNMKVEKSCTWEDEAQCAGCYNKGNLNCRWKASDLLLFIASVLPAMLGVLAGAIIIGLTQAAWWPMIAYILFFPVVLGIAEMRFLCSHCPYYAQEGRILHCLANHGTPKLWRYHPEPMNKVEKDLLLLLAVLFLLLIPGAVCGYDIWYFAANGAQYGIAALAAAISLAAVVYASLFAFCVVMVKNVCSNCVNFSCPINRVDKKRVDAYLMKNPVMRKAWIAHGYKLDNDKDNRVVL
jgi:hypothetical protein